MTASGMCMRAGFQIKDFFNFDAILTKPRDDAFDPRQTKRLPISTHFVLNVF
jgi:hypothetical protein